MPKLLAFVLALVLAACTFTFPYVALAASVVALIALARTTSPKASS